jgi:deoxyribonuclease-4
VVRAELLHGQRLLPLLGVCLDTCHAFAAGHDQTARGGTAELLDRLTKATGPGRLKLIHAEGATADIARLKELRR